MILGLLRKLFCKNITDPKIIRTDFQPIDKSISSNLSQTDLKCL